MDWDLIAKVTIKAAIDRNSIVYALAAIGLNLHFGYTGLLNFGQVGFMAAGAYGCGISMVEYDAPLGVGIMVGLLAGVAYALLLGIPTLRLRADYLAIVTIAAGEIVRLVMRAAVLKDWSGGSNGLNGFANGFQDINPLPNRRYGWYITFSQSEMWEIIIGWSLIGLCALGIYLLMRSPWGRVLRAIREDEDAARALGKSAYSFKMQSLILGGVIGSLAGIFFAVSVNSVQPDNYSTPVTFFALTAAILGGLARVGGPIVGAMIFWVLMQFIDTTMREAKDAGHIPDWLLESQDIGQVRFIIVGVLLITLLVFRPQGIFGDRREIMFDR